MKKFAVVSVNDICGVNSYEKVLEMAGNLKNRLKGIHTIKLLSPGIDIAQDLIVKAFVDVFGEDVNFFGGSSSNNMRGLINYQYYDGVHEHCAWAAGIADSILASITRAILWFCGFWFT